MSWYENRLGKLAEIMEEKNQQHSSIHNAFITINMTIANMNTLTDYEGVTNALRTIKGVESFGPYQQKKLSVTYNQFETSLEYIVYKLSVMGYRYINRF
ncbi:MAG: hypothetical protein APF76_10445 [Desulfitibacter sp. BRH_c19]|nr:MAG: hypothetical protein APF76_10445 [Desulfitibacter sp. BRH_c19]